MTELPINSVQDLSSFLQGSVLLIDKPLHWTSFDVVNKIKWHLRHHYKAPKFKIGHAGTLDPLATGLLVICVGKFTKQIDGFQGGTKEYTGTIRMGQTTPSYDLETAPEGHYAWEHFTEQQLRENAAAFVGDLMQTPPAFSAKWVDGKRAYHAARAGEEIVLKSVPVTIESFELTRIALPEIDFRIRCSKGTYIRSLAHDFGKRLGSGSHLQSLRRTASLPFDIAQSINMDELMARFVDAFGAPTP